MHKALAVLLALQLVSLSTGCATVFHGSNEKVRFTSDPDGATVYLDGENAGKTPFESQIDSRHNHTVEFKKEGYDSRNLSLQSSAGAGWVVLDVVFLLLFVPLIVDASTGNWGMLDKDHVAAHLDAMPVKAAETRATAQ
jgi:hypothetical protein